MANNVHFFSSHQQHQKIYNNDIVNESNVKYNMKYNPYTKNMNMSIDENNNGVKKHHYIRLNDSDIKQLFNANRGNKANLENNLKKLIKQKKKSSTKKNKQRKTVKNKKVKKKRRKKGGKTAKKAAKRKTKKHGKA